MNAPRTGDIKQTELRDRDTEKGYTEDPPEKSLVSGITTRINEATVTSTHYPYFYTSLTLKKKND